MNNANIDEKKTEREGRVTNRRLPQSSNATKIAYAFSASPARAHSFKCVSAVFQLGNQEANLLQLLPSRRIHRTFLIGMRRQPVESETRCFTEKGKEGIDVLMVFGVDEGDNGPVL